MKKSSILVAAACLFIGAHAFADEATIIDFTLLSADDGAENSRTLMDYSEAAGSTFTDDQKALMKISLAFNNWEVDLNSSARNVNSLSVSRVTGAKVKDDAKVPFAGKEVLACRVAFPVSMVNANAKIVPAFKIPAYEAFAEGQSSEDGAETRFEGGYGVVKNVGTIKTLSVTTMGMNFPYGLYVILENDVGVQKRYFMGYLGFDGWKELKWNNPSYVSEVRAREIRLVPIYPNSVPFVKFVGLLITRDAMNEGGDFVGYFKDVRMIYDKAVLETERDIADEDIWGIITAREAAKQNYSMSGFGKKQVNRFLENEKRAQEDGFSTSSIQAN